MTQFITTMSGAKRRTNVYHGRCQCGAVRYQVELLSAGGAAYAGSSVWECIVKPGGFELLDGGEALRGLQLASSSAHHFYCERCGVRSFTHHAQSPCGAYYSVDMRCLDGAHGAALS